MPASTPLPSPVAHWSFDDCTGNIARNLGAGEKDAALRDHVHCVHLGPARGSAYFNGRSAHAAVADHPSLRFKRTLSITAWVKPDKVQGLHTIVNKWYAKDSYLLLVEDGKYKLTLAFPGGSNGRRVSVSAPARKGDWTHVAAVYDGATMKLFLNGKLAQSKRTGISDPLQQSNRPLIIGNHPRWNAFQGHIDEIRLYNEALSRAQIRTIMAMARPFAGEVGRIRVSQPNKKSWHRVRFKHTYEQPVVIVQPPSAEDIDLLTVRLRNVKSGSFEVQLDEWDYLDGIHDTETIHYLVLEAGRYALYDGTRVDVGLVSTNHQWASARLGKGFAAPPVVLAQSQTANGGSAIVTRLRKVTRRGFDVRVQEEEKNDDQHNQERIGYVAFAVGMGLAGESRNFEAGVTPRVTGQGRFVIRFARNYKKQASFVPAYDSPVFLASIQTYHDAEPASLRLLRRDHESVELRVLEERSSDSELIHGKEVVGYVVFENPGAIYGGGPQWNDSTVVGAGGGNVSIDTSEGTGTVEVPADAVDQPVTIYQSADDIHLGGTTSIGPSIRLGPENLDFEEPICITLPFDKSKLANKPPAYRAESITMVARDPENGRFYVLMGTVDMAAGTVRACTHRLATFSVVYADGLASALRALDAGPAAADKDGLCQELRDVVDLQNKWQVGNRMYYFTGFLAEVTAIGLQRHWGRDLVWDLYNHQFAGFTYQGAGIQSSIAGLGASMYGGYGWGARDGVLPAWLGRFLNFSFAYAPLPVISPSAGIGMFVSASDFGVPDIPPDGVFGGAVSVGVGVSAPGPIPVSYTASTAVWKGLDSLTLAIWNRYNAFGLPASRHHSCSIGGCGPYWVQFEGQTHRDRGIATAKGILLGTLGQPPGSKSAAMFAMLIGALRDVTQEPIDEACECSLTECMFSMTWTHGTERAYDEFNLKPGENYFHYGPNASSGVQARCGRKADGTLHAYLQPSPIHSDEGPDVTSGSSTARQNGETLTCSWRSMNKEKPNRKKPNRKKRNKRNKRKRPRRPIER